MGAAAAIVGGIGAIGSAKAQAEAAEAQARAARDATANEIFERQAASAQASGLSDEARANLQLWRDQAVTDVQGYGGEGLAALGRGYGAADTRYQEGGQSALAGLGASYGGAEQAMLGGYGQALGDWAGMAPAMRTVGPSGVMGLGESALQRAFAQDPGAAWQYQQGMAGVPGAGGAELAELGRYNQGLAAQGYGDFVNREMQGRAIGLGALESQAGRTDQWNRAQTSALAGLSQRGGSDLANYLAQAGQGVAGQQWDTTSALGQLSQQRGAEEYAALSGLGTQLGGLAMGTGSQLAAALTGQGQLGAELATGIDRSALIGSAGSDAMGRAGAYRDFGQLGFMLGSMGGGGGSSSATTSGGGYTTQMGGPGYSSPYLDQSIWGRSR